ncbi:MAG: PHP domain-containing protein [bacterium]
MASYISLEFVAKKFKADLHIHTTLSPCAELDMTPKAIIKKAKEIGLDIIAITDHNSAENVDVTKKIGEREGIFVISGIEATTKEEVHILALFENDNSLFSFQERLYQDIPIIEDEGWKEQVIVDENNLVLGFNKRLLISVTSLKIEDMVSLIHSLDGIAIAPHIERAFGIIAQLGFIPDGLGLDGIEGRDGIASSDAHFLEDIGCKYTIFSLEKPSLFEIKSALQNKDGRYFIAHP